MRGRPNLYSSYRSDGAILSTTTQKVALAAGVGAILVLPFLGLSRTWLILLATTFVASIGAIGLNLVTGYAGQISLGHAFFLGVGAYVGAALSGDPSGSVIGLGLDMLIWLPAAGIVAAAAGVLVAPVALRLKGLYLALVTLGLVFLGEHIFRNWDSLTGGSGIGRKPAVLRLLGWRFDEPGAIGGISLSREQQIYFFTFILFVVLAFAAKNLARSRVGRAFSAIRDRDIAAEVMGVDLTKYKVLAFAVSSFYAGVAGSLYFTVTGFVEPASFNLLLSILFIAMVVIGGASSIAGSIMGAAFVTLLPQIISSASGWIPFIGDGAGGVLSPAQLERILFGGLIVFFLIFEPLGLYGVWIRVRNYWKAWPFSY
ncbi:MAG: branched-chain amino acid ABC transporter permease [Gammaproteobacteria bacterium]|nr:branched-chain amino acid ABC transporter permease [Gammaproteobacteria bacterium]